MYDVIVFNCKCGQRIESQTKVLGTNSLHTFIVGNLKPKPENVFREFDSIFEEKLFNCLFKIKEKCPHCGAQNIIKIVDGKLIEVVKDKNELILVELNDEYFIEEKRWGGIV